MKITKLIYNQTWAVPAEERIDRKMSLGQGHHFKIKLPTSLYPRGPHEVWVQLANHLGYTIPE